MLFPDVLAGEFIQGEQRGWGAPSGASGEHRDPHPHPEWSAQGWGKQKSAPKSGALGVQPLSSAPPLPAWASGPVSRQGPAGIQGAEAPWPIRIGGQAAVVTNRSPSTRDLSCLLASGLWESGAPFGVGPRPQWVWKTEGHESGHSKLRLPPCPCPPWSLRPCISSHHYLRDPPQVLNLFSRGTESAKVLRLREMGGEGREMGETGAPHKLWELTSARVECSWRGSWARLGAGAPWGPGLEEWGRSHLHPPAL